MKEKVEKGEQILKVIAEEKARLSQRAFPSVVGHDEQKDELLNIALWFKHYDELTDLGLRLPQGVLLVGEPGNGKSLLIRETLVLLQDFPHFAIQGSEDTFSGEILDVFEKAKEAGRAIVVIDELDLLLHRNATAVRALQESMDGVNSKGKILVLAATNDADRIPAPLLRNGRFDRIMKVPYLEGEDLFLLLKKSLSSFDVGCAPDVDEEDISLFMHECPASAISAIASNIVLRAGFKDVTADDIREGFAKNGAFPDSKPGKGDIHVAYHEAGHAIMALAFPQYYKPGRICLSDGGGYLTGKMEDGEKGSYESVLAQIQVGLAGNIAQKIVEGTGSLGCFSDLENAKQRCFGLVNLAGLYGEWRTISSFGKSHSDSPERRRNNEKRAEKLLKSLQKKTYRYLRKRKDKIIKLGQALFEKRILTAGQIKECIQS